MNQPPRRIRRARSTRALATGAGGALAVGGTVAALLAGAGVSGATTYTVASTADSGGGSLRQAVIDANTAGGPNTIDLTATGLITLTTGQMQVTEDLTITGPGAASLTISGNDASRIFKVTNGATLTFSGLTLTDGHAEAASAGGAVWAKGGSVVVHDSVISSSEAPYPGGGIMVENDGPFTEQSLTVTGSLITGNSAQRGGGVYTRRGTSVVITGTVVSDNTAVLGGGGVYTYGDTVISDTLITGNTASGPGGGVYFQSFPLQFSPNTLDSVTVVDNTSGGFGGGVHLGGGAPSAIRSSTITGNSSTLGGGGVENVYGYGANIATIEHSTIAGNTAPKGSNVMTDLSAGMLLDHTLIADGVDSDDLYGTGSLYLVANWSLIESGAGDLTGGANNVVGEDPLLGTLQTYSDTNQVIPFLAGSPAYNAGDPAFVPPPDHDQRGLERVFYGRIDIGAFELQPVGPDPDPTPGPTPDPVPEPTFTG